MIKKSLMKLSFFLSIPIMGGIIMASCANQAQHQNKIGIGEREFGH